jgi:hypothetical protein
MRGFASPQEGQLSSEKAMPAAEVESSRKVAINQKFCAFETCPLVSASH